MSSISNVKKYLAVLLSLFMLSVVCSLYLTLQAQAQPPKKSPARIVKRAPASHPKAFVDSRFHHNRSYPARGQYFMHLPPNHRVIMHHNSRYYSHDGVWYRHHGGRYVVVAPPIGLFIPFLPLAYSTIWFHGVPYYYANETYYTRTPGGYVVVEPPQGEVSEAPTGTEEDLSAEIADDKMFIYPRQGQSREQQDYDRYECHKWAVEQTNYDPTKMQSEISADQIMQKRSDYQRAMAACLDSRGYTAK